ncbi:cache domain-containing sensor histidine kinase [Paenibacillus sp. y28]|uniref:cache domain-containing sensor histidine kinase n=1 Tax=Paenibacillus sp. y28 TaxID=3129110 RepID=UPI0030185E5A
MRKILSALLNSITGKRRGSSSTKIKYVRQSDAALARKFFYDNFRRIIVLSLIPLTLLGSLSIFITERYVRQSIERNNESRLNQLKELTQLIPAELDSLSLSFDKDPKIKNRLRSILNTPSFTFEELEALFYLRNVIDVPANSKPFIDSIYIYYDNPYGRFLSTRDGIVQLDSALDTTWFSMYESGVFEEEQLVTQPRLLYTNTRKDYATPVITVYKPFAKTSPGRFHGLIIMNVLPAYFEKSFRQFNDWPGSYYYIADRSGTPLVPASSFEGAVPVPEELPASSGSGLIRFPYHDAWVSMKQTPRLGWNAVSVVPTNTLFSLPRTLVYYTLSLVALSLLLSVLYALWITRKNYRQIVQIVNVLEHADDSQTSAQTVPEKIQDVYELIVKNILDTFLEQNYLRVQLSERQAKMELLELKALQSQMNPHFMSNTLHSIYWKAFQLTRSPNEACLMIEQLSDLLEYALRASEDLVTLKEELANVRGYVELQRTRFGERLHVLWDDETVPEACRVVKISLQPLVENSVHIGLEARQQLAVKIKCRLHGPDLKVTIIDNGPGMTRERLTLIRGSLHADTLPGKHVGLSNTSKRLALHYGSPGLMRVLSKEGLGTAITLTFPQTIEPFTRAVAE